MKKLLLALGLFGALCSVALAVNSTTNIGNANYTMLASDVKIVPTVALTANRTITLVSAGQSCLGQTCVDDVLLILDAQGNVGGANSCLIIAPASGETINGSASSINLCSTYGWVNLYPTSGSNWYAAVSGPGQTMGTVTNDNAPAGYVGEIITSGICAGPASTATVTITIAAPGVFTDTAHGITGACPVVFTNSGGGLPTGITSGTTYYITPASITTNTYSVSTTVANALAGTSVTTTGTSTGTQTRTSGVALTTATAATITGVALTAGDWECRGTSSRTLAASTSVTKLTSSLSAAATTIGAQGSNATLITQTAANVMGAAGEDQHLGPARVSLAATTNEYIVMADTFTVSTNVGFGNVTCRRAR